MIRCINRLEEHQRGQIIVDGTELTNDLKDIEIIRREVGMVFQHFNLFPHLTVLENLVLAPMWVRNISREEAEKTGMMYLERVKIPEQAQKFPGQLSGGQQQRVAIARAIAGNRPVLLADEPTGNLDIASGKEVMQLFKDLCHDEEHPISILMVTHDPDLASNADRMLLLNDGKTEASDIRSAWGIEESKDGEEE